MAGRRKSRSTPLNISLKDSDKLQKYMDDLTSDVNTAVSAAVRHGIAQAINVIRDKTRANIAASDFQATQPTKKYGVPLIEAVQTYMVKGQKYGQVNILGPKENLGLWITRFFEMGAKRRNRGMIGPRYFFKKATANAENIAVDLVEKSIQETINNLNS